jgi:glycerol kinase
MKSHILSIDQGTTGTTVVVLDEDLNIVGKGYKEVKTTYPNPGWVEQNPEDLWDSVKDAVNDCIEKTKILRSSIKAIGITNQRETTVLWEKKTMKSVCPAIVWQCRRTQDICEKLKNENYENLYREKTGLVLDPYFSGTKIRWLLDEYNLNEQAENGEIAFGTVDSFLINRLTNNKKHLTDHTNASRTLLFNLYTLAWDEELLKPLNIPKSMLPKIQPSCSHFGKTENLEFLPDGIPINGVLGDQQAALFGQGALNKGDAKCTFGTGAFLMLNTGKDITVSDEGLLTTVAWSFEDEVVYALEGSAFIAGAAVQWLRDGLKIIKSAPEIEELAKTVKDSGGVFFVPAMSGLGAPYWRPEARGLFYGITRGTGRGHLAKAVLDGIALQNHVLLKLMEKEANLTLGILKVDGGAAANNILLQFQADIIEKDIIRPVILETTAFGAGVMAALGAGIIDGVEGLLNKVEVDTIFHPNMDKEKVIYYTNKWNDIVNKA